MLVHQHIGTNFFFFIFFFIIYEDLLKPLGNTHPICVG